MEIPIKKFNGHRGYIATDSNNNGVLDDKDEVRKLVSDKGLIGKVDAGDILSKQKVAWNDEGFSAARADFSTKNSKLDARTAQLMRDKDALAAGNTDAISSKNSLLSLVTENKKIIDDEANSPLLRSAALTQDSVAHGIITKVHNWFFQKPASAAATFEAIKAARAADPENPWALLGYTAILGVIAENKRRSTAESYLKISANEEMQSVMQDLAAQPNDLVSQIALDRLLLLITKDNKMNDLSDSLRQEVDLRLPKLRAANTSLAAQTDAILEFFAKIVSEASAAADKKS